MILLISSQQADIHGRVDNRFGRAPYLIKVDSETNRWESIANSGGSQRGGAGVAAAQLAVNHHADVVVSGDIGPNAAEALKAAGIEMKLFDSEINTVQEAIDYYKQGKLTSFG